jgi:uncharacterized membrane protein YfcA
MLQTYFLNENIAMTLYRQQFGFLTTEVLHSWCYCVLGIPIGSWIGKWVFEKISSKTLKRIVYIYMIISGIFAIVS